MFDTNVLYSFPVGGLHKPYQMFWDTTKGAQPLTRFERFLAMGRDAMANNDPEAWDAFFEGIVRAYGRRIAGSGQYVPTSESKRVEQSIVVILEREA